MTAIAAIDLQEASEHQPIPTLSQLSLWVDAALQATLHDKKKHEQEYELTVRIVDEEESQTLNRQYRSKDKPTNVLSFPFEAPAEIELNLLGDLVICAPVVAREAEEQSKQEIAHWAHMVIHGTLHLLGYDHIEDQEADVMEALEVSILSKLGFPDPYTELLDNDTIENHDTA